LPLASGSEEVLVQLAILAVVCAVIGIGHAASHVFERIEAKLQEARERRKRAAIGEDHYDFRETTLRLGVTDHQLRELIRRGALEAVPLGLSLKFRADQVDALASGEGSAPPRPEEPASGPKLNLKPPPGPTLNLKLASDSTSEHCPFCRDSITAPDGVGCSSCGARHHAACWEEHGKCSTCAHSLRARRARS
jgi:RING finger family protein